MANVLNIDTSGSSSFVSLVINSKLIGVEINEVMTDHASFVHPAIKKLVNAGNVSFDDLDAIAVVSGPGSYTGIRVGMASAKGLCLALNKPLIAVNMLKLMAFDAQMNIKDKNSVFCPLIDARRMEVFTAIFNHDLHEIMPARALIIDEHPLNFPEDKNVYVFGSGAEKCRSVVNFRNCTFIENVNLPFAMSILACEMYDEKLFTSLINSDPLYLKEFYHNA